MTAYQSHTLLLLVYQLPFYSQSPEWQELFLLVGFDLFIIVSFVTVQGLRDHLTVYLVPSAENPETHLG